MDRVSGEPATGVLPQCAGATPGTAGRHLMAAARVLGAIAETQEAPAALQVGH
jgi:hypothetical protein